MWTLLQLMIWIGELVIIIQRVHGQRFPSSFACGDYGVNCSDGSTIDRIQIYNKYRGGRIPTAIGTYTGLTYLYLGANEISGLAPTEIGLLTQLKKLDLSYNFLLGPFPTEMGLLTQLTWLSLESNSLSGSIPTEMGLLTQLTWLSLDGNSLSGSIPTEMGMLTQLTVLDLSGNSLSGPIPTEMGRLTGLRYIALSGNSLSGSIPTEMGLLTRLTVLYLQSNPLCGPVPSRLLSECPLSSCLVGYGGTATCKPSPSTRPSRRPSTSPSADPSIALSTSPWADPSIAPSVSPSANPSIGPSTSPSADPSIGPSTSPSADPSIAPSTSPLADPSIAPSTSPSADPSIASSTSPSVDPSIAPSTSPSIDPSIAPSTSPSADPSIAPSTSPSADPSIASSTNPLVDPSIAPSTSHSADPSIAPSTSHSADPSIASSTSPSADPSIASSTNPSVDPSIAPSTSHSADPSIAPSTSPSADPSIAQFTRPSVNPSFRPSDNQLISIAIPTSSGISDNGNTPIVVMGVVVSAFFVITLLIAAIFASRYWDDSYVEKEEADGAAPSIVSVVSHYCVCWGHGNLLRAASEGNIDRVRRCIDRGCDVNNSKDKNGWTALHIAAKRGHWEILNLLIDNRADLEARNNNAWTALHIAAKHGHLPTLNELLNKNADVEAKTTNGSTALQIAAMFGNKPILETLLSNSDLEAKDNNGLTALHWACFRKQVEIAKVLLDRQCDVSVQDKNGKTAVHIAASEGSVEILNALLAKSPDLEAKDNNGWTALHWACFRKQVEIAKVLLDRQCDVSVQDKNGKTAVHIAASEGSVELFNALLEKSPDLEAKDNDGQTALHSACINHREDIAKVLLSRNVNVLLKDNMNRTPLDLARTSVLDLLESYINDKRVEYKVENYKVEITSKGPRVLFGTFLACRDTHDVVIKLPMEAGALSKKALSKEAEIYKRIAYKKINETMVPLFWDYTEGPSPYLVIEKFGHDLRTHMMKVKDRSKISINIIIVEILNAVCFLHRKGYIHTDIKPANILIDTSVEVRVKLCDLDSATEFGQDVMHGTRSWKAPEIHFQTDIKATPAVDMFSVGLVVAFLYDSEFHETVLPDNDTSLNNVYADQMILDAFLSCTGTSNKDIKTFIRTRMCNIDAKCRATIDSALSKFDTRHTTIINEKLAAIEELEKVRREYEDKLRAHNSPEEIKKVMADFFKSLMSKVDNGSGIKDKFENDIIMNHISDEMRKFQESQNKSLESAIDKIESMSDSVKDMKEWFFQINKTITFFHGHLMKEIESKHRNVLDLLGSMRTQMSDAASIQQGILGPDGIPTLMIAFPVISGTITDWFKNPYKLFENEVRVFFICQYTLRIVKCGPAGEGFLFRQAKKWVQATAPILKAGLLLLQIGLVVGTGVSIPFADSIPGFNSCLNEEKLQFIAACTVSLTLLTDAYTIRSFGDTSVTPDQILMNPDDASITLAIQQLIESTGKNKFKAYSDIKEYFNSHNINTEDIRAFSGLKPVKHRSSGDIFWIAHDVSDEEFANNQYNFKSAGNNL